MPVVPNNPDLIEVLRSHAAASPEQPAILAPGAPPVSFAELMAHAGRLSRALAGGGFGSDDVVAAALPDAATLPALLGVYPVCAFAPLSHDLKPAELEASLRTLAPRALLVASDAGPGPREAAERLGIAVYATQRLGDRRAGLFTIPELAREADPPTSPSPAAPALVMLTSATTGRAKAVPITRANMSAMLQATQAALSLDQSDRFLNMMPLFHLQGLMSSLGQLAAGGGVVVAHPFDAECFPAWVDEFQPTWYTGGPALHRSLIALCRERPDLKARLRFRLVRSIGAALAPALLDELRTVLDVPVIEGYGLTEGGVVTTTPLVPYAPKAGSAGKRVWPGVEIMDEAGNLLPAGSTGEIVLRGPNVVAGYRNDPVATRDAFRDGWFRTGDLGRFDDDGYLFVTGRIKEMINRGGEKILPGEIDEALLAHPGVVDAAAFAIPHPQLGDDVAAAVVARPGAALDEAQIRDHLGSRLSAHKVPRVVVFLPNLPKSATGKPQRARLAAEYAELQATRANRGSRTAPSTPEERKLAAIWEAALGRPVPSADSDFFELGGHSLAAARVVARIEEVFGVKLGQDTLLAAPTLRRQAAIVAGRERLERDPVVRGSGGAGAPFFMVRPLVIFRDLFERLGAARTVVGLALPTRQQAGRDTDWPTIARLLIAAIRERQPHGPYHIGGWCADGVLAFEIARQLAAAGDTVGLVALFDTPCPAILGPDSPASGWRTRWSILRWQAGFQWISLRQLGRKEAPGYIRERLVALVRHCAAELRDRLRGRTQRGKAWAGRHDPSGVRLRIATYDCQPYSGALTLFRAEESHGAGFARFPAYGWDQVAETGVRVHTIPGDHVTMFLKPNVDRLVAALLQELGGAAATTVTPAPSAAGGRH